MVHERDTVEPVAPKLNPRSLHMSEESTYTESVRFIEKLTVKKHNKEDLLCSPLLVPHITGGALLPGAVTEKMSVWH